MQRTVLLFDVDGVLIQPGGYREALRRTLDVFADQMGQRPISLTDDEIHHFESIYLTNEWDSSAMCAGALLIDALADRSDLVQSTLAETLEAVRASGLQIERPDLAMVAETCMADHTLGAYPSRTIHAALKRRAPKHVQHLLDELYADIWHWRSPITYLFQQHTLGGEHFRETYGEPPRVEVESMLLAYDKPLISEETKSRLQARMRERGWHMALFTARPSRPPSDDVSVPDANLHYYPPEADLAAELLGFEGPVPMIASGRLAWLATRRQREIPDYVKPSAVHALAAIGAAISGQECAALDAAAELNDTGAVTGPLEALKEGSTRVVVFEDAAGGIYATQRAVEALQKVGLAVKVEAVGISPHQSKRDALSPVADRVVDDINEALKPYL